MLQQGATLSFTYRKDGSGNNGDDTAYLILEINQSLGTTIVVITHELSSIFAIGKNAIYLDSETKSVSAYGNPHELLKNPPNRNVLSFLTGGRE